MRRWIVVLLAFILLLISPPLFFIFCLCILFLWWMQTTDQPKVNPGSVPPPHDENIPSGWNEPANKLGLSRSNLLDLLTLRREIERSRDRDSGLHIDESSQRLIDLMDTLCDAYLDSGTGDELEKRADSVHRTLRLLSNRSGEILDKPGWLIEAEQTLAHAHQAQAKREKQALQDAAAARRLAQEKQAEEARQQAQTRREQRALEDAAARQAREKQLEEARQRAQAREATLSDQTPVLESSIAQPLTAPPNIAVRSAKIQQVEKSGSGDATQTLKEQVAVAHQPHAPADSAWSARQKSHLEKVLEAVSGTHRLLVPFLAQNIGWFIGGLCSVGGSVFLVSYTAGFTKALVVSGSLLAHCLLFMWGGYFLRRRRPELVVTTSVLLSLGVLMAPLCIAAIARALLSLPTLNPLSLSMAVLLTLVIMLVLYAGVSIASGLVDRRLQVGHPLYVLSLSSVQLLLPLLVRRPDWWILAVAHLLLLTLLSLALVRFTSEWLKTIFLERRKTAYYAAGTLIFSAVVSFLHLSWIGPVNLPVGYYGPFLMLLCGLLFYVDSHFKHWANRYAFFSHLSFGIYGLSVLAVNLAGATGFRTLTLLLAAPIYAFVCWSYQSYVPLYLFLASSAWLYEKLVLEHLPNAAWFLATLPFFGLLYGWNWLALRRRSPALALIAYRVLLGLILAVLGWSLAHDAPGFFSFITALIGTTLAYAVLAMAPMELLPVRRFMHVADMSEKVIVDLRESPAFYVVTFLTFVSLIYLPPVRDLGRPSETAMGLLLVSGIWLRRAMIGQKNQPVAGQVQPQVNSAILALLGFAGFILSDPARSAWLSAAMFIVAGGLWFQLGLRRSQALYVYAALVYWGLGVMATDTNLLSLSSKALLVAVVSVANWVFLWHRQRLADIRNRLAPDGETDKCAQLPISSFLLPSFNGPVEFPLQQGLLLAWGVGHYYLAQSVFLQLTGTAVSNQLIWSLAALANVTSGLLTLAYFRGPVTVMLPLAWITGLAAFVVAIDNLTGLAWPSDYLVLAIGVLAGWNLMLSVFGNRAFTRLAGLMRLQGGYPITGGRGSWEKVSYVTIFTITTLASIGATSAISVWSGTPMQALAFMVSCSVTAVFWWQTGQRYGVVVNSYLVLLATMAMLTRLFSLLLEFRGIAIGIGDPEFGLILVIQALVFWGIAGWIERGSWKAGKVSAFSDSLYRKPLRVASFTLSLTVILHVCATIGANLQGSDILTLTLAALALLLSNHILHYFALDLIGILVTVATLLGLQTLWLHDGRLVPSLAQGSLTDYWLTLSLLAVALQGLSRTTLAEARYGMALRWVAWPCYFAALLGALDFVNAPLAANPILPWASLSLGLGLLPLLYTFPFVAAGRGLLTPLLLTAAVISGLVALGLASWMIQGMVLWAFALLACGYWVTPAFNVRRPDYQLRADFMPWIGLLILLATLPPAVSAPALCGISWYVWPLWRFFDTQGRKASFSFRGTPVTVTQFVSFCVSLLLTVAVIGVLSWRWLETAGAASGAASVWLAIPAGIGFLWQSGQRYRLRLNSYLIMLIGWGIATLAYVRVTGSALDHLGLEASYLLMTALLALGYWGAARLLDGRLVSDEGDPDFKDSLYRRPLRVAGVAMALGVIVQLGAMVGTTIQGRDIVNLALVAAALLLSNRALRYFAVDMLGVIVAIIVVLWLQALWLHEGRYPVSLAPDTPADYWLTLGLLSLALQGFSRTTLIASRYGMALRWVAWLSYATAFLGLLFHFVESPLALDPVLPWATVAIAFGPLLLLRNFANANLWRGYLIPILLTIAAWSGLVQLRGLPWLDLFEPLWALVLLGCTVWIVPRFNARYPNLAVAPDIAPWLGLIMMVHRLGLALVNHRHELVSLFLTPAVITSGSIGLPGYSASEVLLSWPLTGLLVVAFAYCMLMNRLYPWRGWITVGIPALQYAGASILMQWLLPLSTGTNPIPTIFLLTALLLWSCFLMGLSGLGLAGFRMMPAWNRQVLEGLRTWPLLLPSMALLGVGVLVSRLVSDGELAALEPGMGLLLPAASLVSGVFLLAMFIRRDPLVIHLFLTSLCLVGWVVFSQMTSSYRSDVALYASIWNWMLMAFTSLYSRITVIHENEWFSLGIWRWVSLFLSLTLAIVPMSDPNTNLWVMILLLGFTLTSWLKTHENLMLKLAWGLLLALLHRGTLLLTGRSLIELLPWFALEVTLLATGMQALGSKSWIEQQGLGKFWNGLAHPLMNWLAVLELVGHGLDTLLPEGARQVQGTDATAAISAAVMLLCRGCQSLRGKANSPQVYGLIGAVMAVEFYVRLVVLGLTPVGLLDTLVLMVNAYILMGLHTVVRSRPLHHASLLMPIAAILSAPLQLESAQSTWTALGSGVLYLFIHRDHGKPYSLYLAMLVFNLAAYLWVPAAAQHSNLLQVYIAPAAITVLILLHLHASEIKSSVLHSARMAATTLLYFSMTLDVFLSPQLWVFMLAIGLSLVGVITGIAFRIRAFLYAGTCFMTLNILGQIIRLFPEQRVEKAIFLMLLGAIILGCMIMFSLKRESILRSIRIYRADIASWS